MEAYYNVILTFYMRISRTHAKSCVDTTDIYVKV